MNQFLDWAVNCGVQPLGTSKQRQKGTKLSKGITYNVPNGSFKLGDIVRKEKNEGKD